MDARFAVIFALVATSFSFGCGPEVTTADGGSTSCEAFKPPDPVPWPKVTVRLHNSSNAPLYLGSQGGCGAAPFQLKDEGGKDLLWQLGPCSATCASLQAGGACQCGLDCPVAPVLLIAAGSSLEVAWQGSIFAEADMPAACFSDPTCAGKCLLEQAAPEGTLEVLGSLWTDAQGCGTGPCTCDPGSVGSCQIPGPAAVAGKEIMSSAKLSYPSSKLVEVVFQ